MKESITTKTEGGPVTVYPREGGGGNVVAASAAFGMTPEQALQLAASLVQAAAGGQRVPLTVTPGVIEGPDGSPTGWVGIAIGGVPLVSGDIPREALFALADGFTQCVLALVMAAESPADVIPSRKDLN